MRYTNYNLYLLPFLSQRLYLLLNRFVLVKHPRLILIIIAHIGGNL